MHLSAYVFEWFLESQKGMSQWKFIRKKERLREREREGGEGGRSKRGRK